MKAGATGGKLVRAGRGGFLLFYATEPRAVRAAMETEGLTETRFSFDLDGSVVSSGSSPLIRAKVFRCRASRLRFSPAARRRGWAS